ncbi:MAG: SpoIIE family protein phosphatase [Clostridium sp.]|nr:SpoIIE family protein phosphatase [Clostridium sp.]
MFQNISTDYVEERQTNTKNLKENFIKQNFSKQLILIYLLSFMVSIVQFGNNMAPFAIAIIAAITANNIPILIPYIITCIGTFIGFGGSGLLTYILTSLVFMALSIFVLPKMNDKTEQKSLMPHLIVSTILVQVVKILFGPILIYDILLAILFTIITSIFYKIFKSSISVIKDSKTKKAFSIEEVIGTSLVIAIAISAFGELAIFGYSIRNILCVLVVLVLGWQNGILIGATSGVTIGVVIAIIQNGDPVQIAAFAISGMIAGLLNKIGKIGVIIGFLLGNIILSYATNGNTHIKINIEDFVSDVKYLPKIPDNRLEQKEDMVYKLNNVSDAISEMANTYKEVAATVLEENEIEYSKNKEIFVTELENNINDLKDNVLYDDLVDDESPIVDDIFKELTEKSEITRKSLLNIFEAHNNYILGFDDSEISNKIMSEIDKMVKAINASYRISKINFIWKRKIVENKEAMGNQLDGISKTISNLAEDINMQTNTSKEIDEKEELIKILEQKKIGVKELNITKEENGKIEIGIYISPCEDFNSTKLEIEECKSDKIKQIINKFYKQEFEVQLVDCSIQKTNEICYFKYISKNKYKLQIGLAKITKDGSPVSGDTTLKMKLQDGKQLIAISDGMGSGPNARKSSKIAVQMLKRLLISGFNKKTSLDMINSSMCLNSEDDSYATLDIAIFDLYEGNVEFIKNGASPTYIKNRHHVDVIKNITLPTGILNNIELKISDRDVEENEILVMCSDGIAESNAEYENKELWLKYLLEQMETNNAQKMADIILKEAIDNNYGIPKDDMTVVVCKIEKN